MPWSATNSEGYEVPAAYAVDIVVLTVRDSELSVLLMPDGARRSERPVLPGGFVGFRERSLAAAQRKLDEKTGITGIYLEKLDTYDDPDRDPRGWILSSAYVAFVPADVRPLDSAAAWHPVTGHPALGYDHDRLVEDALQRLAGKLWWSNIAAGALPDEFALSEAKRVYEAIASAVGDPIVYDTSTFKRDLVATGLVEPTGGTKSVGRGPRAKVFRFKDRVDLQWGGGYRKRAAPAAR